MPNLSFKVIKMPSKNSNNLHYLIGVDGGGTQTRVIVADLDGQELARGQAGPSGLINGATVAWDAVLSALQNAFNKLNLPLPKLTQMAIGLGLAGVHNKQWAAQFLANNPGFDIILLETDAFTTLLGAHGGKAGAIIAIGTGSVGEAYLPDGSRIEVGGWGFPTGDEASGAWLGIAAINHLQHSLDGRAAVSDFSAALLQHCGGERDAVFNWLANARQHNYAQLAPLVVQFAALKNPAALQIMQNAALEVAKIAAACDPNNMLKIALCGGLAQAFYDYLPSALTARIVNTQSDAATGALLLIKNALK